MSQAFHGGRLQEAVQEFGIPRDRLIDFSSNINPFAPMVSPQQWEKWRSEISSYPEAEAESLRQRLAEVYQVEPEHIIPTAGGIEALYLAARVFQGKRVSILEPSFSDYTRAFVAMGEPPSRVSLPRSSWSFSIASWSDRFRDAEVIVIGNPNNPTGSFFPRTDLLELWAEPWAQRKSWIIDEAFMEFVPDSDRQSLLGVLPANVIVLRSLTKSWALPGLRLGFAATSNQDWLEQLRRMQPPWQVNSVAQGWAETFLTINNHQLLLTSLQELNAVKGRFQSGLLGIPGLCLIPSAANFFLIHLEDPLLEASRLYRALGQRGLIVRRCDSFYEFPQGRFLRLAVRSEPENIVFCEAFRKICSDLVRRAA